MTCYTSALSTVAYVSSVASHPPPSSAAVRLFSLNNKFALNKHHHRSATSKIVHLVRHAEGTHNLSEAESKLPTHFDAALTPKGIEQCNQLAQHTKNLEVEAVLVSPLTRCLDTSRLSFPHLYDNGDASKNNNPVPFIAHEEWRETVNFLCDCRRPTHVLEKNYPRVSFDCLSHDHDPIWSHYEKIYGSHTAHTSMRESGDADYLYNRTHSAWKALLNRPEKHLALVGHSAFFMHMFTPLYEELEGVVQYEDDGVRDLMTMGRFDNCELRSVVVDIPIL
mmetsp:Transcript_43313/g.79275  ORF Transcript_43313/g.79275 Transcript_43313/m.79275 type:complete len:279 (-) Transcript_43313:294-1130(-)